MKVLLLGGYGNFGARIARALAPEPTIDLLVGGRNAASAEALAEVLGHGTRGVAIDHERTDLAECITTLGAELVIHTAGPFQQQGYGVAMATAAAGAHYIDLADGRRFVCDFSRSTDAAFRAAGRSAVCGASTVPGLSSAVIDHLVEGWQRIDSIDMCIAPAQTAPRGVATLRAVLDYCGAPVQVWDDGRWQDRIGWSHPEPVALQGMATRLGALCDIPDLELFVERYRPTRRVVFRAALEVRLAQRVFDVLARLRSHGLLPDPARLAGLMHRFGRLFDALGSSLGGMVVQVAGLGSQGRRVQRAWHISADHDHGPEIPCMAAITLARRLAAGGTLPAGSQTCMGLVRFEDFGPLFEHWGMVTHVIDDDAEHSDAPPP